jgi:hypothetical protein
MNAKANRPERAKADKQPEEEPIERKWKPPERSDQAPGEEAIQVNDAYAGDAPPSEESPQGDEQHPTGG